MQPKYHELSFKINARKENVEIYRRLTGLNCIPDGRGYWTLCNYQPLEDGAEIVQMVGMGLLKKHQFHGVDRDTKIVSQNKIWHPDANWYSGDWTQVIEQNDFDPSLVYLDTTCFADHRIAADVVSKTMTLCPAQTVLLANVMLNDPRSGRQFDKEMLINNLQRQVPSIELTQWRDTVENFVYSSTGKTIFMTYVFYKP